MVKNPCGKMRKPDEPYEIWENKNAGWKWYVLKKYQMPENEKKNPRAIWFCKVFSPMCPDGELGDVYVNDIKQNATKRV